MGILLEKGLNFNRKVKINFEGGNLTSDAGKIINSSRYLTFKLFSSCPYKNEFWDTLTRINDIAISP
ncbi:hypothetical protein [uncultured Clostridium sp.]|uniref:hypothetical protein n=1 Tax=uncultured Clostridium sp. TaxID=59620 RepID=UPI0028ED450F|nr:hypothetical protein [uncultured Clostridium sp.]